MLLRQRCFVVILPFEWSNPVTFLSKIYFGAYSGYQYTSINAFNLWGCLVCGSLMGTSTFWVGHCLARLLFSHCMFCISGLMFQVNGSLIFAAFMLFFAFFMLPTRIHERYLFPAISMLALMFPVHKESPTVLRGFNWDFAG